MEGPIVPVLHNIIPEAVVVSVEVPQLFTTVTIGRVACGAATPEPTALTHLLTVLVTVYMPGVFTVIEAVVAPLLQSMVPPAGIDSVELVQLFTTVTAGAAGRSPGVATPRATALVQPLTVCFNV